MLWRPDPDKARGSRIAGFARWVREHRGRRRRRAGLRRPARLVRPRPRRILVGGRRAPRRDLPRPADRDAGPPRDAGHPVVPGRDAQLRRARPDPRPGPGGRRRRRRRGRRGRDRSASSPTRSCATSSPGPAPGWRRPGWAAATGSSRWPRTRSRRWWPSSRRRRWARCGRRARRTSAPAPCSTASRRSSPRCWSPSTATATTAAAFDVRERVAGAAEGAADAQGDGAGAAPRPRRDAGRHGAVGGVHRHDGAAASSRRCRSTTRCGCCTRRGRPACPRASCSRTAGSSSSTSRRWRCTTTSVRATGSCGSPPPAG